MCWMAFFNGLTRVQFPIRWLNCLNVIYCNLREAAKDTDLGGSYYRED